MPRNGYRRAYHPEKERNSARRDRIANAKAICNDCPALLQCRAHALRACEPYGIWGGLSESERAVILGVHSPRYPAHPTPPTAFPAQHHATTGLSDSQTVRSGT